jgi:thioredoxin 1
MLNKLLGGFSKKAAQTAAAIPNAAAKPPRPQPVEVTDAGFATVVEASDRLAVVDFWAEWCEPCTMMSAYVSFLSADYADQVLVAALDVDENPVTAERYGILGLPTLLFLRGGQEIDRIVGVEGYDVIKQRVDQLLSA